ncbi:MAG TPA: hypothetical protein VN328_07370 [Thermodesulfovibrionales bacterium]|nr:hypothetical protein [Thermodesulfovibrionales bacterium]
MTRYKAGEKVGKGTYWNITNGNRVDIPDEGTLPGDGGSTYKRFSPGIVLLAGPVIGLLYVIAMPFIAVGTIVMMIAGKLLSGLFNLLGSLVSFGWRPSEAHLTGKKGKKKEKET